MGRFGRVATVGAATAVAVAATALPAGAGMLKVGDAFPVWELTDDRGARITSADLAGGRYLVWFYPKASTPG
jgi:hypothetical protein